ncbi:hypothetical protein ACN47E_004640 [Coniothyrium glycines]
MPAYLEDDDPYGEIDEDEYVLDGHAIFAATIKNLAAPADDAAERCLRRIHAESDAIVLQAKTSIAQHSVEKDSNSFNIRQKLILAYEQVVKDKQATDHARSELIETNNKLQIEIGEHKSQHEELLKVNRGIQDKESRASAANERLVTENRALSDKVDELQKSSDILRMNYSKLQSEYSKIAQKELELQTNCENQLQQIVSLEASRTKTQEEHVALLYQYTMLNIEYGLQKDLTVTHDTAASKLEKEIRELRGQHSELLDANSQLHMDLCQLQASKDQLQEDQDALRFFYDTEKSLHDRLKNEHSELRVTNQTSVTQLQTQLATMTTTRDELESKLTTTCDELTTMTTTRNKLTSSLKEADQDIAELLQDSMGLASDLNRAIDLMEEFGLVSHT